MDKKNARIITICGVERPDFAYYVATLLSKTDGGCDVLVVDNSRQLELFLSVKSSSGEVARQDRITFVHDRKLNDEAALSFAYIVCFLGTQPDEEILSYSDAVCIMTDYMIGSNNTTVAYSKILSDIKYGGMSRIIFINKPSGKFQEKVFLKSLYIKTYDPLVIWMSDKDMAGLMSLEINGRFRIGRTSQDMREAVVSVCQMVSEATPKDLMKLAKKN